MKALRKFPVVLAVTLLVMWLLLNNSLAPGQIVLGVLVALFFAGTGDTLRPLRPSVKRLHLALGLLGVVLIDIVRSNLMVARIVLGMGAPAAPGFMKVPLDLRDPHGLAILAMILTATPGTVWVDLDREHGSLTLHILDLHNENIWIDTIKQRYERPLMEIFQ